MKRFRLSPFKIVVASHEESDTDNILDRGFKLLEFLEERWNVTLEDEESKIKLLLLCMFSKDVTNSE